jgi:hypothetical protein
MTALGLWPLRPNNIRFYCNFIYISYCMFFEYLDLLMFIDNFEHVLMNLTENLAFTPIILRIYNIRKYNKKIGELVEEVKKDFNAKDYTDEERKSFISYHVKSIFFMKLLIANTALTATSYYVKPLLGQIGASKFYFTGQLNR